MLTIVHLLLGAAIGKYFSNLWLIIPIAFLSHYLLDFIPHSQPQSVKKYKKYGLKGCDKKDLLLKAIEPILGIVLTFYLSYINFTYFLPMIIGAFFSWLPDLFLYPGWRDNSKIAKFIHLGKESKFHKHIKFIQGMLIQLIITLLLIYIINRKIS